jgi:uncharacterized protein (TIRG00374 family)
MIRLLIALLVSLVLGLVSLYLVAPDGLAADALDVVRRLNALGLAGIAVPVVLWWLLSGWRLAFLTAGTSRPTNLWQGVQTHVIGTFSAVATPAGGGNSIGIVFLLNRFGLPANEAVAVAVMALVGDLAFFGWAAPASYLALRLARVQLPLEQFGLLVGLLAAVALVTSYLLVFRLSLAINLLRRIASTPLLRRFQARSDAFLGDLELAGQQYSRRPWHWHLRFHLLSSAARLPYFAVLNLVLLALMVRADHLVVYAAQVVLHAFAFLVPTPGASGYQEAAMTFALKGHVGGRALAAAVILWRLYQHYSYFLVGPLVGGLALSAAKGDRQVRERE